MEGEGLDALIVITIEDSSKNVYYLTGFGGTVGALVVSKDSAALAVDARYTERARSESAVSVVEVPPNMRAASFLPYITTALEGVKLPPGATIGYEGNRIPFLMAQAWEGQIQGLKPTKGLVEGLREVKDADEIVLMQEACAKTTKAFADIIPLVVPSARESDIARSLDIALITHGALKTSFSTIVASGPNAAIPHHETSDRALQAGESVVIDFGGMYPGGYASDITRTLFVPGADPDPELIKIYNIVLEANQAARKAMKVGMLWKDYDAVARAYITERGYGDKFGHGLGHSIGLEVHDVYDYAASAFQLGTVMSDEPGIYLPGKGGVRIEDDLVLTETGAELLNNTPYLIL